MSSRRPPLSLLVLISWLLVAASACGKGGGSPGGSSSTGEPESSLPPGAIPLPSGAPTAPPSSVAQKPPSAPAIVTSEGTPVSFAPLARKADPAVATVKARVEKETSSGRRRAVSEGLGTAFVYDPEGFMLTNNHVIEDATDIVVGFVDGREMRATVVGRDKHTDIAVLRVDERGLPSLSLGDSDGIDVGDWVVAIGNPFGLSHTVSAGSSRRRAARATT